MGSQHSPLEKIPRCVKKSYSIKTNIQICGKNNEQREKQKIKDKQRWEPQTKPGLAHVFQGGTHLLLDMCHVPCYSDGTGQSLMDKKAGDIASSS